MKTMLPLAVFTAVAIVLLLLDLFSRRGAERLSFAEAVARTAFFGAVAIAMAVVFGFASPETLALFGLSPGTIASGTAAEQFLQAYLVEITLSVDNILVVALIFGHFGLSPVAQHRVLFWGVIGAFLMRAALILLGAALLERFAWATYIFGAVLLWSALRLLKGEDEPFEVQNSKIYQLVTRVLRVSESPERERLFVREGGRWVPTLLIVPLLIVEATDLVFAVDSIPAVLAITRDPVLAYTSNLVAVLGMRSLYFLIVPLLARLRHLRVSLILVLLFIAAKLLMEHSMPISTGVSLAVTGSLIVLGVIASLLDRREVPASHPAKRAVRHKRLTALNLRSARRAVVLLIGSTVLLLAAGLALLAAPGLLVAFGALTILATEFAWARLWLRRVRRALKAAAARAGA